MIDKDTVRQCSTFPGIYLIRNTVNNKYYVGQAINLRNRLKAHLSKCKSERYDSPLYRAVKKYTWEVFEYSILEILETKDFTKAKKQLDVLEVKYIEQYNSYNCGYNQTLDGDKESREETEEQQEIRSVIWYRSLIHPECFHWTYDGEDSYSLPEGLDWRESSRDEFVMYINSRQ